uniref:Cytochrome b5 heme-binding domain-containing protein n=1 Tax=Bracon brevicornis TaxID=1563983 RepID=A0A6V7IJ84_9HYME
MSTEYTAEEVSRHNTDKDIWLIIHGGVYDVTKFLKEHPGGEEVLLKLAGTDATTCFDDMGHTTEAIALRETYRIGDAIGDSSFVGNKSIGDVKDESTEWMIEPEKQKPSPLLPIFVGIGAIVYALLFYYLR